MFPENSFEVAVPEVIAEEFGTEIVVLNLGNGKYFSLTGLAMDLWRDVSGGHRPKDLVDRLMSMHGEVGNGAQIFFQELIREGLIRPAQTPAASPSLEAASVLTSCTQDAQPPRLEAFDDMAELILSDPIHDVDEDLGWPVKREPTR
jgi:hypothetical protein